MMPAAIGYEMLIKRGEEGSGTEQKGGTSSVVQENETLFSP